MEPQFQTIVDEKVEVASAGASTEEQLRLRQRQIEAVLQQCQLALEMLRKTDLVGELAKEEVAKEEEATAPSSPKSASDDTDELCDLLMSRVESPDFLGKLDCMQKSMYQTETDEARNWDIVGSTDLWEEKHGSVDDESETEGFVLVSQEDIVEGIACFMAAYLLSLKQTKELSPDKLQKALCKMFSATKRKSKLEKAWDGTRVIYNLASWSATAVGIYQNPAIVRAATEAFSTTWRIVSKLM